MTAWEAGGEDSRRARDHVGAGAREGDFQQIVESKAANDRDQRQPGDPRFSVQDEKTRYRNRDRHQHDDAAQTGQVAGGFLRFVADCVESPAKVMRYL